MRIAADGEPDAVAASIAEAYRAIERVEQAMSFHRTDSALHALHRADLDLECDVDGDLWRVLDLSKELWRNSGGVFDVTLAPHLVEAGLLPLPRILPPVDSRATLDDLDLPAPGRVILRRRMWLDLGGIAKGYAVDLAMDILRRPGVSSASVNAGGDLACFGATHLVAVRDPRDPARLCRSLPIVDAALATSAAYFRAGALRGSKGAPTRRRQGSVSVLAPRCAVADGLSKVVWAAPHRAPALLCHYAARGLVIDGRARARWLE